MGKYSKLKDEMRDKIQKAGGTRYSKSDHTALTHALLNDVDHEVPIYMRDCSDPVITRPVEHYRESLKPVLKQFGVDAAELDRIRTVEFPKDHAEALNELSAIAMKDYIDTGRKIIFPITSTGESQMEIATTQKDAKTEDTRKPVEVEPGKWKSVPTGERRTTKPHTEGTMSNKIPEWLVTKEKI